MSARIRFISAGAGSGKTTALAELLRQELAAGRVHPGGVLATTFTNRAATELRERVRAHLIREGAYELATAMGSARIGTVNSVCGSLLQRFAFEAGLSTEQRVLDEPRAAQLLREALDTVVEGPALSELLRVARRLSLLEPVRSGDPVPWRKALKALVDQALLELPEQLASFVRRIAHGKIVRTLAPCSIRGTTRCYGGLTEEIAGHLDAIDRRQMDREEGAEIAVPGVPLPPRPGRHRRAELGGARREDRRQLPPRRLRQPHHDRVRQHLSPPDLLRQAQELGFDRRDRRSPGAHARLRESAGSVAALRASVAFASRRCLSFARSSRASATRSFELMGMWPRAYCPGAALSPLVRTGSVTLEAPSRPAAPRSTARPRGRSRAAPAGAEVRASRP